MSDQSLLAALYSSEERHAVAMLDIQIEKAANGSLDIPGLTSARGAVLQKMVGLSRRIQGLACRDGGHVWRLIAEDRVKHPGFTRGTLQRQRRYFCERCLSKHVELDDEPIYQ